jgi:hypothetical protein
MLYTLNQPWTLYSNKASNLVLLTLHTYLYSLLDALNLNPFACFAFDHHIPPPWCPIIILTYFEPIIA